MLGLTPTQIGEICDETHRVLKRITHRRSPTTRGTTCPAPSSAVTCRMAHPAASTARSAAPPW